MNLQFKEARKAKGYSQAALSQILQIDQTSVSFYEIGKRQPSLETLSNIADALDVSTDYLLGRTSIREPYPKTSEETDKPETSGDHDKIMAVLKETGLLDLLAAARKIGFTPDRREDAQ